MEETRKAISLLTRKGYSIRMQGGGVPLTTLYITKTISPYGGESVAIKKNFHSYKSIRDMKRREGYKYEVAIIESDDLKFEPIDLKIYPNSSRGEDE